MRINLYQEKGKRKRLVAERIQKVAKELVREIGLEGKELNIILCSPTYIRGLARNYLKRDYAPVCLSFPLGEEGLVGEIYINQDALKDLSLPHILRHALKNL